jgi:hypothetical protein
MKYHFVWDEGFLGNQMFELSEREKNIVIATIVGGHNAIFTGYRTERLVKAIKFLRNANIPFVSIEKPINERSLIGDYSSDGVKQGFVTDADKGILHFSDISLQSNCVVSWLSTVIGNGWIKLVNDGEVVQLPAGFQLVAEMSNLSNLSVTIRWLKNYCDIRYDCPKDVYRTLYHAEDLMHLVINVKGYQLAMGRVGSNCKIADINNIKPSSIAREKINNERIILETARLGRTLADISGHGRTFGSDLEEAKNCQNICM